MKRTFAALLAAILAPLCAHAVPIAYEFSATIDTVGINTLEPVPADIQAALSALKGQAMVGTFNYESDVGPPILVSPSSSTYNGMMTDLAAHVAGFDVSSAVGSGTVGSAGPDRFVLNAASIPPPVLPFPPAASIRHRSRL